MLSKSAETPDPSLIQDRRSHISSRSVRQLNARETGASFRGKNSGDAGLQTLFFLFLVVLLRRGHDLLLLVRRDDVVMAEFEREGALTPRHA